MAATFLPPPVHEAMVTDLQTRNQYETRVSCMNSIDQAAEAGTLRKLRFEEAKERQERAALTTQREEADERLRREEQHEALGRHIDRHNRLELHDAQKRFVVRRDSLELRELEQKLRAAYVGHGIRAQLAEREAQRLRERMVDEKALQEMLRQRQLDAEFLQQQRQAAKAKKLEFRHGLLEQMEIHSQQKQRLYAEFLREKQEIDAIVKRFYEESLEELHAQHQKKQRFRDDLMYLRQLQEGWAIKQKQELEEENKRIAQFLVEKNAKEDARRKADLDKLKGTSDLAERMGQKLVDAENKRLERQELLDMLKVEEMEEALAQQARDQLARRIRDRLEARTAFLRQRADRAQRQQREQEDEREYRRKQMEVLAERDRIEQLSNERRRQRIAEHNRVVLGLLAQRREQHLLDLAQMVQGDRDADADREQLKIIIEEERIKILQEHAAMLGGVFPRGVLRESDRAKLNL